MTVISEDRRLRPMARARLKTLAAAAAASSLVALTASVAVATPVSAEANLAPVVTHTGAGPTGYSVTFSFDAPAAARVQIKGEWYFERPSTLTALAGTPTAPVVATQGILPTAWQAGDVPIAYPNATAANWPVADLVKGDDGVWTYTTPLPSGVFSYGFFVDCASDIGTGCTQISDPSNEPWNESGTTVTGSLEASSQVYVPSDPAFGTVDYSWQTTAAHQGDLTHVTYPSPGHVTPVGQNYLVVYTPPGYDPDRATKYPTLYLSHGGGGNEVDWSTQGALQEIIDNLIATGQVEPMVVVMPNNNGYVSSTANGAYRADIIGNVIPYVQSHYNVGTAATDRAFSGLSAGGIVTNSFMLYDPETFQYYGTMSAGLPPANQTLTDAQVQGLTGKSIFVGGGWQDPIHAVGFGSSHYGPAREISTLTAAGLPVTTDFVHGGHEWYVWRILLKDFVTRVAFLPSPYASWNPPAIAISQGASLAASAKVGQTLTAVDPRVSVADASFTYQWLRDDAAIDGATGRTYDVTTTDVGARLSVRITVAKSGFASASTTSAPTSVVTAADDPTITVSQGVALSTSATVGQTLTAVEPQVTVMGAAFAYQWLRNGTAIAGATSTSFRVAPADLGAKLSVRVTVTKSGYSSTTTTSAVTKPVTPGTITVTRTSALAGAAKVGSTLSAVKPTVGVAGATFTYRWLRDGKPVSGATRSTYPVTGPDLGAKLSVAVSVAAPGYTTVISTSPASTVKAGTIAVRSKAKVTGSAKVGKKLTAVKPSISVTGASFSYRWYANGKAINGGAATKSTFTLTRSEKGKKVTVRVVVAKRGYTTVTSTSAATATVR